MPRKTTSHRAVTKLTTLAALLGAASFPRFLQQ
jgi:hypothetical protein